jgi:hypothetical protein
MNDPKSLTDWEPQGPPVDFPDRVLSALRQSPAQQSYAPSGRAPLSRWSLVAAAIAAVGLASAVAIVVANEPPARGELVGVTRTEQAIGRRAVAVLEPQAHVRFSGDRVWQDKGSVFYRVNPGQTFSVQTPVGTVEVRGTCFRVAIENLSSAPNRETNMARVLTSAAGGIAIGIVATVIVYEGRVRLSHGSTSSDANLETLDLTAGERATLDDNGVHLSGPGDDIALAVNQVEVPAATDGSTDVTALRSRIAQVRRQKAALEERLEKAQRELSKYGAAAGEQKKDEYDLTQEDWKELAKDGSLKFRTPCPVPRDWEPKPDDLDALGLAPSDAESLAVARRNSSRRLTELIRPLCLSAVGNAAAVEAIDNLTCLHIVADVGHKKDEDATSEAMRQVAEVNAGLIAGPTAEQLANPVFAGFYAYTNELSQFQKELTESFGPEQAKAIAFGKGCFHVIQHRVGPR